MAPISAGASYTKSDPLRPPSPSQGSWCLKSGNGAPLWPPCLCDFIFVGSRGLNRRESDLLGGARRTRRQNAIAPKWRLFLEDLCLALWRFGGQDRRSIVETAKTTLRALLRSRDEPGRELLLRDLERDRERAR